MPAIQEGSFSAWSPARGRCRNWLTAAAISSTPSTSLSHPTTVEGSPSEGWITPDRMTKIVVPTMMPSSQPIRNPVLVRPACGAGEEHEDHRDDRHRTDRDDDRIGQEFPITSPMRPPPAGSPMPRRSRILRNNRAVLPAGQSSTTDEDLVAEIARRGRGSAGRRPGRRRRCSPPGPRPSAPVMSSRARPRPRARVHPQGLQFAAPAPDHGGDARQQPPAVTDEEAELRHVADTGGGDGRVVDPVLEERQISLVRRVLEGHGGSRRHRPGRRSHGYVATICSTRVASSK